MTVTYGGSITLGEAMPMALRANAELDASIGLVLPDIQARLDGALAISISPPPSLAELIASVQALLAALQTLLSTPLPDISATLSLIADLQASLGQLNLSLGFSLDFGSLLAQAGIHYFVYAGAAGDVGSELSGVLSAGLPGGAGPSEQCAGAILLASDGGAIAALQTVLRT